MVKLFPTGRCKLSTKHPELPTGCGNHCCLPEERTGSNKSAKARKRRTLSVRCAAASKYHKADKLQQLLLHCLEKKLCGAEWRGILNLSWLLCSTPSLQQSKPMSWVQVQTWRFPWPEKSITALCDEKKKETKTKKRNNHQQKGVCSIWTRENCYCLKASSRKESIKEFVSLFLHGAALKRPAVTRDY